MVVALAALSLGPSCRSGSAGWADCPLDSKKMTEPTSHEINLEDVASTVRSLAREAYRVSRSKGTDREKLRLLERIAMLRDALNLDEGNELGQWLELLGKSLQEDAWPGKVSVDPIDPSHRLGVVESSALPF